MFIAKVMKKMEFKKVPRIFFREQKRKESKVTQRAILIDGNNQLVDEDGGIDIDGVRAAKDFSSSSSSSRRRKERRIFEHDDDDEQDDEYGEDDDLSTLYFHGKRR